MAQPVVDVSSVTISPKSSPCRVHGLIIAVDNLGIQGHKLGKQFYRILYARDAKHPEHISEPGQALSVSNLDTVLMMKQPLIVLRLQVELDNGVGVGVGVGVESENDGSLKGIFQLNCNISNDYEEVKQSVVEGSCGRVMVNYIALSCALAANIFRIRLLDKSISRSALYGSIDVHYDRILGDGSKKFSIPLLNGPSNQCLTIVPDKNGLPCIKLARTRVAVPAYARLMIKANLVSRQQQQQPISSTSKAVVVVDGNDDPAVLLAENCRGIGWPDSHCNRFESIPPPYKKALGLMVGWDEIFDLQPLSQHTHALSRLLSSGDADGTTMGRVMLEVFSVFIGRENNVDLNVSGKITLEWDNEYDARECVVIFNKNESNPDKLVDGRKLLGITFPSGLIKLCPLDTFIKMSVDLKDAGYGFSIEDGCMTFDMSLVTDESPEFEFDRPLCSVIKGVHGYCAVHYAVFESAERVNTKITLLYKGKGAAVQVHGKVVAWSDLFRFNTTNYDCKYNRRILFDEPNDIMYKKSKTDQHSSLGEVELSESSLVVPVDFSFHIYVDVYAKGSGSAERLCGTLQLQVDEDEHEREIQGDEFDLHVTYSLGT